MMRFSLSAVGGTFDIIHKGHIALLITAFSRSHKVIIGITSDEFAIKLGKHPLHNYSFRFKQLNKIINTKFPNSKYKIIKINDYFGPLLHIKNIDALIVSEETKNIANILNNLRQKFNLSLLHIITIPLVIAQDGIKISSTRIKNFEIDIEGNSHN